jgi:hypothetical protein
MRAACGTLVVLLLGAAGCRDDPPPPTFWTESQAESIKLVRGTSLEKVSCSGMGAEQNARHRRFSCVARAVPASMPELKVRVRYVLNPRGPYCGKRSAYLATRVRFDSFGVP